MKKVFFVRHKRDNAPYLLVTVNPGGTDFQPLSDEADDVADVFDSVYKNRQINRQELDSALDDDFTIEGPINPTRGNLNLVQDFLADANQPLSPRKTYPSAKSFDISSVPLGFSDKDGKVNLTEYKARNFIYEQTKSTFNYEVKRVRALWDPGLSIPGTGRRGGWRCPVGTRYGGQITDRFGRNCGWGVARRIANAITNIGERMENIDDRRRGRRVERRNRRMLERLGRAEGAGRAERGLRNIAEVLDGGEITPTPAPERPRGRGVQARRRARNTTEALADARDRGLRDSERRRVRRELEKPGAARTETSPELPTEEKPIPAAPRKRPRNARKPAKRPQGEARNDVTKPVGGPNETEDYAGYVNRKYNEYAENVRKIRERGGRAGFLTRREWYDINKRNLDDAWRKKGKGEAPDDFMPPTPAKKRRRQSGVRKKPPVQEKEPSADKPDVDKPVKPKKPKKKKRMWTIDYGRRRPRNRMIGGAGRGENRNIAGNKELALLTDDELITELERINNDEFMKDWDIRPAEREAIKKNIEAELKYRVDKLPGADAIDNILPKKPTDVEERNIADAEFDAQHVESILDVAGIEANDELMDALGMSRGRRGAEPEIKAANDLINEYIARRAEKESVLKREARLMRVSGETANSPKWNRMRDRVRAFAEGLEQQGLREIEQIKKKQDTALKIAQNKVLPLRARYEAAKEMARNVGDLDAARIRVRQAREALANVNAAEGNSPTNPQIFDSDSPIQKILDDVQPLLKPHNRELERRALNIAVIEGRKDFEDKDKNRLIQEVRLRGGDELVRELIARNEDNIKANLRVFRNKMKKLKEMDDTRDRMDLISDMEGNIRMAARLEAENAALADILSNSTPPKTESTPPQAVNAGREIDADRAVNDIGKEYERLIGSELDSNQKAQMRRKYSEAIANENVVKAVQKDKERFDEAAERLENEQNQSDAVAEMRKLADESLDFMKEEIKSRIRKRDKYLDELENANEARRAELLQRLAINEAMMDINARRVNTLQKRIDEYVEKFLQERQDERDAGVKPVDLEAETVIKIGNPFKAKVVPEFDLGIDFGQGKGMGKYKEIKNPKIKNALDAINFVKDGGDLREVPHEYWRAAIEGNSSRKETDKTKRFRQLSKNGGIIGDTRLFVLRDAAGKPTNRGIVFKASKAEDNLGELVGWNLAHQVGIIKGGAVADGENEKGKKFIMIPFAFNDVPDGNNIMSENNLGGNYHIENVKRKVPKQLKPNMYAARLNQELLNYILAVSDRHDGNGMAKGVELPNGDVAAHVIPLDLGWAGKVYKMEGIGDPLRNGNGVDRRFWNDLDDDLRNASPELKTRIQDAVINAYDNAIKTVGDAIAGGEAEFIKEAQKNFKNATARAKAKFLYKVIKERHERLVLKRDTFLKKIGR